MKIPSLPSSWSSAGLGSAITLVAVASCAGIEQRVELLRADRVEIVDEKGIVKLDVEKQIRALEERIARLEAAAAAAAQVPAPAPPPAPAPAPAVPSEGDASTNAPGTKDASPPKPARRAPGTTPPLRPTDVF